MIITNSRAYTECFMQLANVLDLDENRPSYHSLRVAAIAYKMGELLNSKNLQEIFWSGLLHDIGAFGYNDFTVSTSESISVLEKDKIFNHTIKSAHIILKELPGEVGAVADFVKYHHEKFDGTGFPEGLAGNEIPLCSQIIKLADDLDTALRIIPEIPKKDIYEMFKRNIDREYSAEMVSLLIETLEKDNFFAEIEMGAYVPIVVNDILNSLPCYNMFLGADLLEKITTVFADIIDAKHEATLGHSGRVAAYSQHIAEFLKLNPKDIIKVKLAGFMHDIGKAAVPRNILNKRDDLSPFELHVIKGHPVLTMDILKKMSVFNDIVETAGYHHERLNGSGYPNALPAENIPFLARIVMVADVYDAMTSGRRYQKFVSREQALDYIIAQKNILFDADAVGAMVEVASGELKKLSADNIAKRAGE